MTLEADERVFRRRLKRRLLLWRIAALLALAGLAVLALQREGRLPRVDHIARLDVTGIILENSDRTEALRETAEDPSVKALIVHINSPGGTVVGGESLFGGLGDVAAERPVAVVMGVIGGYFPARRASRLPVVQAIR